MTSDARSDSDTGEQLTGSKHSLNIPLPAWLLLLVVIMVWLFGLGMEHGPGVFDIGAAMSGYDRYLTVLGSQSTAGLWISGVIALLLFGIFALVRKLRDGQLPGHSSRLFLVILVGLQVWFVSSIQNADESQAIREYLEMYGSDSTSNMPISVIHDDPVQATENLWLMRVYEQGSTTTFEFQFDTELTSQLPNMELARMGESMGRDLADETCADIEGGRRQLESGRTIKYVYLNANDEELSEVSVSEDDCSDSNSSIRNEAKAALLRVAVNQEKYYLHAETYTSDLTDLGFPSDPFSTASGLYVVSVVPGADRNNFIAVARYTGQASEAKRCREFSISGRGERHSSPQDDCWN